MDMEDRSNEEPAKETDNLEQPGGAAESSPPEEAKPSYLFPPLELTACAEFKALHRDHAQLLQSFHLPLYLGTAQEPYFQELSVTPNILIAGTIGSGKTQFIYNQIANWLYTKHYFQLKLVLCGSKPVDYMDFLQLQPYFLLGVNPTKPIVSPPEFLGTLNGLLRECETRLALFNSVKVKSQKAYNKKFFEQVSTGFAGYRYLPDIVVVIDDLFNFLTSDEVIASLIDLSQKNLNTGIYILAATSQISAPQIARTLKANFNFRLSFKLMSQLESKKILDKIGAEKLSQFGELLFYYNGRLTKARQFLFPDEDLLKVMKFITDQQSPLLPYVLPRDPNIYEPRSVAPEDRDPMFEEAARLVVMHQQGSTSLIQRKLKTGYNRAGRILEQMESAGIVGPFEGIKAREVLIPDDYSLEIFLEKQDTEKPSAKAPIAVSVPTQQEAQPSDQSGITVKENIPDQHAEAITALAEASLNTVPKKGFWGRLFNK